MRRTRFGLLVGALALALLPVGESLALRLPRARNCPVFPSNSVWNKQVDELPVHPNTRAIVRSIGLEEGLHADFGSGRYNGARIGIPITVVDGDQRKRYVDFEYADESDRGPYPIPRDVKIEGGRSSTGDRHAIIVDKDACKLFELFALYPRSDGGWRAGSGAIWDLRSNEMRPRGWTSADAAGLPILPGLARYDEVRRGGSTMPPDSPSAVPGAAHLSRAISRATSTHGNSLRWGFV